MSEELNASVRFCGHEGCTSTEIVSVGFSEAAIEMLDVDNSEATNREIMASAALERIAKLTKIKKSHIPM
ncbi:hypothetical protein CAOG_06668 [Capsaspora owczarzaki ATCC 30864]|uniref:Uncharacterized protein n=1 Tax=Capsaspora owczarzaki (strain ATCC 30864) TaxID=595528 RepID=A0A0D2UMR0_CAPO3|nr:hypothetical protein CAOG_06668 [Capsaspora owczarzaki ATCC 30864]KJE96326.1 hypothetical protein CAOG_006668 [Capsaspora owczarzaki ATCC 30864]|eukprot:XP_004344289.1 hypothetical protein CAOG_06668 [Capsaspora owczarzaki ATCC 30864]